MGRILVAIPYFQREHGILAQALHSVCAQRTVRALEIVIVDDGSPAPPDPEIASAAIRNDVRVTVLRQRNAGVAAARNRALAAADDGVTYIAFLDSDDVWSDDHLASAEAALDRGYDFYFADYVRDDEPVTVMRRSGFTPAQHDLVDADTRLHRFRGGFFDALAGMMQVGTSTVVYRTAGRRDVRFREDFRHSHEDTLFWMDIVGSSDRVVFSDRCTVRYGRGVNIYHASGWGSESYLGVMNDELKFCQVVKGLAVSADTLRLIAEHERRCIRASAEHIVYSLLKRRNPGVYTREMLESFPGVIRQVPGAVLRLAMRGLVQKTVARR